MNRLKLEMKVEQAEIACTYDGRLEETFAYNAQPWVVRMAYPVSDWTTIERIWRTGVTFTLIFRTFKLEVVARDWTRTLDGVEVTWQAVGPVVAL